MAGAAWSSRRRSSRPSRSGSPRSCTGERSTTASAPGGRGRSGQLAPLGVQAYQRVGHGRPHRHIRARGASRPVFTPTGTRCGHGHLFVHLSVPRHRVDRLRFPPTFTSSSPQTRPQVAQDGGRSPRRPPAQLTSATTKTGRGIGGAGGLSAGNRPRCWPSTRCPTPTRKCDGSDSRSMTRTSNRSGAGVIGPFALLVL